MLIVEKLENNIDLVSFNKLEKLNSIVADDVRAELSVLFEVPNARVIISLDGVKYIDSTGFGCFLTVMKAARNNYGTLKICNIDPGVFKLFRALHLHTVLSLYDDLESCVNSF
ncbi:MAG: STAS domain-containing protein [Bacteroidales bacterium]|nr:STAS domain-containing protein [Bacteroidales bacterium]